MNKCKHSDVWRIFDQKSNCLYKINTCLNCGMSPFVPIKIKEIEDSYENHSDRFVTAEEKAALLFALEYIEKRLNDDNS